MMRRFIGILAVTALLAVAACAPAAAPAPAPAPAAPSQPKAPAPAVAPQAAATPTPILALTPQAPKASTLTPKYGGHLVIPNSSDWPHFDPHLNISNTTQWRASLVYLRLVKKEPFKDVYDVQVTPDLAEKWEAAESGKVWTFYLRKGVKWANVAPLNGREVTADDVVYSFERALSPVNVARGKYDSIKKVEKVDKYTVRFTLKEIDAQFLPVVLPSDPSWIVPKEAIDQFGDLKSWGVGAGPYMLDKAQKGVGTFYKKNPNYFDASKIYTDYHDIPLIPDKATALAAFRAGNVDVLGFWGISPTKSELDALKKTNPDIQSITYYSAAVSTQLWIRFGAGPFNDLRVRKALNHALDRDSMIKALYEGDSKYQGYTAGSYPTYGLSQEELRQYFKYDPALSKRLLADAGYPKGFKTNIMWNKAGASTTVELYKQFLKDVGIDLDLQEFAVDYPRWVTDVYQGNYPQLGAAGGIVEGPLGDLYAFNHTKGERNGPKSSIAKIDELIEKAIHTLDEKEQQAISQQAQRLLATEVLYILPCCDSPTYNAWQPWAMNYHPYSTGIYTRDMYWYMWINK